MFLIVTVLAAAAVCAEDLAPRLGAGSGGDIDRIDLYDTHGCSVLRREDASLLRNTKEPS